MDKVKEYKKYIIKNLRELSNSSYVDFKLYAEHLIKEIKETKDVSFLEFVAEDFDLLDFNSYIANL